MSFRDPLLNRIITPHSPRYRFFEKGLAIELIVLPGDSDNLNAQTQEEDICDKLIGRLQYPGDNGSVVAIGFTNETCPDKEPIILVSTRERRLDDGQITLQATITYTIDKLVPYDDEKNPAILTIDLGPNTTDRQMQIEHSLSMLIRGIIAEMRAYSTGTVTVIRHTLQYLQELKNRNIQKNEK